MTKYERKINRILIECSDTYKSDIHTGIQRVVRNIVERSEIISKKLNISIVLIVLSKRGYIDLKSYSDLSSNKDNYYYKESIKKLLREKFHLKQTDNIYILNRAKTG